MGVQDLWSIVEPVRESVSLYSLCGKTLAVDLSLWVCEAQHVQAMMGRVTKPHLRNLFFRVSSLTLMGIKLVFVVEGEAPKIKAETMNKRTEARFGLKKTPKCTTSTSRGRFKAVLRECTEMLDYLGVPWVTAAGEAEAMCAFLDSQGLVDGCITSDGDVFLYGAQTVYRNFNMNTKDPQVDCYRTSKVQTELHLCRDNLVGLAILLGCDYIPKGVAGVGKEQALKLIQSLNGKTLLQRFRQWAEDDAGVYELVVKKVPHCHVCRHPGSAKAHERSGCEFCASNRFCLPQDFDYQCPCDWHENEQTRQALSVEANIRKKTLASPQFPFTEIIREFLISKDKIVSRFTRRQPNMLLLQKFAFDKMEWPKHYTSEKVLVLMTYTELINRKYRREMALQIKPLRILKPRVRNGVACFEVAWSTPKHYEFPEGQPAENWHEVKTVEEESLFCVAYPELVDRYLRDKALIEESKTKKKKPKRNKEKTSDVSDGISDLLAQMTLQSSMSANSNSQPQMLLCNISNVGEPDVVVLSTPVHSQHHLAAEEDRSDLVDCPNAPLSKTGSDVVDSPSVSAAIDALHLSDIDWEAFSFTSSPPPQAVTNNSTETGGARDSAVRNVSGDAKQAESKAAPEHLKERVLLKELAKANMKQLAVHCDASTHLKNGFGSYNPDGDKLKELSGHQKKPLKDKSQCGANAVEAENGSKELLVANAHVPSKAEYRCNNTQKPHKQYKFVKAAISLNKPETWHSDKDKNVLYTSKKSVCIRVCSSSEDSDVENQQIGPERRPKVKSLSKLKQGGLSEYSLNHVSGFKTTKAKPNTAQRVRLFGTECQSHGIDTGIRGIPESTDTSCRDIPPAVSASPVAEAERDCSVACSDSPLPLAERLRLKFLK
ncbi:flap endonuclease GEN homolog 1 [Thalassophryne amazonica]|uniref:flap endonuclease GEN homolog 1 n=1 Tax=Thalassophryne amazonica TaxID=390379 RepID=UPI0014721449|nr:flap endonuclease GEN homolog 1 [Thalassophryne amazonica]